MFRRDFPPGMRSRSFSCEPHQERRDYVQRQARLPDRHRRNHGAVGHTTTASHTAAPIADAKRLRDWEQVGDKRGSVRRGRRETQMKDGSNRETLQAGLPRKRKACGTWLWGRDESCRAARTSLAGVPPVSAFVGALRKFASWVFLKNLGCRSREDHAAAFQASCAEVQQQADSVSGRLQVIDHLRDMR